jgi:hypothetical protein
MRKMTSLLAVFSGMILFAQAQTKIGKISGAIKDGSRKNLQLATITLLRATFTYISGNRIQQNQPRRRISNSQDEQNREGGAN